MECSYKYDRVKNMMMSSSEYCNIFHIGSDNNWYLNIGIYKHIPLKDYCRETLLDMLDEISANVITYKTQLNIVQIKSEMKL